MIRSLWYKISLIFILGLLILYSFFFILKKNEISFIKFNLITSTHTDLPWEFSPANPSLKVEIGEVTKVEYKVKNLSKQKTSGTASFAFYPNELKPYIVKINCFCYDEQTLNPGETRKFILTLLIDPKVTKDTKTKSLKEGILQFVFFESKKFKNYN
tara:strand:+ start:1135 stop:1605 length:471 start_codon:yes stop_codon:yes gene_type:complete